MAFGDDTIVVNRSIKPLEVTYDGQHKVIQPGYKMDGAKVVPAGVAGRPAVTHLPFQVAEMARRQNVLMGTENPFDLREVEYLVGVAVEDANGQLEPAKGWPQNAITHCEQTSEQERLNRTLLDPEAQSAQPRRAGAWPRSRTSADAVEGFRAGNESLVGIDTRG